LYRDLSFDTPFPVSLYKDVLDESMDVCGDFQLLQGNNNSHNALVDSMVGRLIRLFGRMEALITYQHTTHTHRQEDGAYLLMILDNIATLYQNMKQLEQYTLIIPLFEQIRTDLMQAFAL
jgi:hypothetical protein